MKSDPLSHVLFFLLVFSIPFGERSFAQTADYVITNANIVTMDRSMPSAQAIAISGNRIVGVGTNVEIQEWVGDGTKVDDVKGAFVMPGFIESHAHFIRLGESMMMLDLTTAKSWDDVVKQVEEATAVTPPGKWIVGRGWHQSKWDAAPTPNVEGYPTHESMSKITPNNPVVLTHASGHMSFSNAYGMRLAGVDEKTENPEGGEILRSEDGSATGVFRETASGLIYSAKFKDEGSQKDQTEVTEYYRRAVELATEDCLSRGITSFQDAGSSFSEIDFLKSLVDEEQLNIRLWVMVRDSNERIREKLSKYKMVGFGNDRLTVRAIKRSIDGALGPHGAWLLDPYEDMTLSSGLNTSSVPSVEETAALAAKHDFQLCVHAIGDKANREVLDLFERQFKKTPSLVSRRWRIEHAQHLHPDDIPRFGSLGVIASMQGVHCTSDAVFVPTRLGMRRSKEGAYVWKSLLESGAVICNGTDAPVENVNPLNSFYATVTRRLSKDVTFFPEQCLTRQEALESYTINAAYAAFEESDKGSLVAGKLADLVVLSHDLLKCDDEEILQTKVLKTVLDGKVVFAAGQN